MKKHTRYTHDEDDDDDMVRDGQRVRCPMFLMDGQPGFRHLDDVRVRDARRMARDARAEMIDRATNAWRSRPRDQKPDDPDADDPGVPANAVEKQLETWLGRDPAELARDVERRRRATHAAFSESLQNAWRMGR